MNGLVRRSPWVLVLGLLSSSACDGDNDQPKDAPLMFQPRLPFHEPPEIVSSNGVLEGTITSAPTKLMISGAAVNGESYNGAFVGPTLRLEPGDQIRLTLVNQLQQMTNIHFHGFHVSPSGMSDNVLRHVAVGETASYVIDVPATHDQGLFWYHSHMHMDSESQVFQGLSATIVIGDVRRLLPERFRSVPRRLLALKDLQVENGAIIAANIDSNAPTTRTVNGLVEPVIEVFPGATELWQIANISADIFYDVEIEGLTFLVVGEDGNPVEATFERQHLVMPPGKRFEALVTFANEGEVLFKTRAYDQGGDMYPETPLAHVALSGTPLAPIDPLGVDVALAPPSESPGSPRRGASDLDVHRGRRAQPLLHQRPAVRPRPRRCQPQARHRRGVDTRQHDAGAAPVSHPHQRLQGHLGGRAALRRQGQAGHGDPRPDVARRHPRPVRRLHRQVRLSLPHPESRGQRDDGAGRRRAVTGPATRVDLIAGDGSPAHGIDDWVAGVHLRSEAGRVWFHDEGRLVRRP